MKLYLNLNYPDCIYYLRGKNLYVFSNHRVDWDECFWIATSKEMKKAGFEFIGEL